MSDGRLSTLGPTSPSAGGAALGRSPAVASTATTATADGASRFDQLMQKSTRRGEAMRSSTASSPEKPTGSKTDAGPGAQVDTRTEGRAEAATDSSADAKLDEKPAAAAPLNGDPQTLAGLMQALLAAAGAPAIRSEATTAPADAAAPVATVLPGTPGATVAAPAGLAVAADDPAGLSPTEVPGATGFAGLLAGLSGPAVTTAKSAGETAAAGLPDALGAAVTTALTAAGIDLSARTAEAATTAPVATAVRDAAPAAGPVAAPTPTVPSVPVSTLDPIELPQRLGERLRWLVEGGVQEARLRLHPQELGSIDIRVRVDAGSAKVWFAAEHPAARAALETALPQLRERFAGDGLALQSSTVSSQGRGWDTQGQSQPSPYRTFAAGSASDSGDDTPLAIGWEHRSAVHDGLVDRYA